MEQEDVAITDTTDKLVILSVYAPLRARILGPHAGPDQRSRLAPPETYPA
jgi:hypothetical protein